MTDLLISTLIWGPPIVGFLIWRDRRKSNRSS